MHVYIYIYIYICIHIHTHTHTPKRWACLYIIWACQVSAILRRSGEGRATTSTKLSTGVYFPIYLLYWYKRTNTDAEGA